MWLLFLNLGMKIKINWNKTTAYMNCVKNQTKSQLFYGLAVAFPDTQDTIYHRRYNKGRLQIWKNSKDKKECRELRRGGQNNSETISYKSFFVNTVFYFPDDFVTTSTIAVHGLDINNIALFVIMYLRIIQAGFVQIL